jgi:hypothetical protein
MLMFCVCFYVLCMCLICLCCLGVFCFNKYLQMDIPSYKCVLILLKDTENWPMLQSFALDAVVCPTGFFTSRYAVIDITETLDVSLYPHTTT